MTSNPFRPLPNALNGRPDRIEDPGIMPFGRQKGEPLDQVDSGMLRWWLRKMDEDGLRSEYREAVLAVLDEREETGSPPPRPRREGPAVGAASSRLLLAAEIRVLIKAWFGRLSLRFHPDRGGTNEQMIVLTEAYRDLMAQLAEWEVQR